MNTHKGLYRYNRLPFGVPSAPSIFLVNHWKSPAGDQRSVSIHSWHSSHCSNLHEPLPILDAVVEKLHNSGLRLNRRKCFFFKIEYLGHIIDKDGLCPTSEKVRTIQEACMPQNVSKLRSFFGTSIVSYQISQPHWCPTTIFSKRMLSGPGNKSRRKHSRQIRKPCKMVNCWSTTTKQTIEFILWCFSAWPWGCVVTHYGGWYQETCSLWFQDIDSCREELLLAWEGRTSHFIWNKQLPLRSAHFNWIWPSTLYLLTKEREFLRLHLPASNDGP